MEPSPAKCVLLQATLTVYLQVSPPEQQQQNGNVGLIGVF